MLAEAFRTHLLANAGVVAACRWIYPLQIPQGKSAPAIVYRIDDDERDPLLEGQGSLKKAIVNIDCYHTSYQEARSIATAVEAAMIDFTGTFGVSSPALIADSIRLERKFDLFETGTDLYRVSMQFFVAYS